MGDRSDRQRAFGVAAAEDLGGPSYVLLIPASDPRKGVRDLQDGFVHHGAPLAPEKAIEFATGLAEVARTWDSNLTDGQGRYFEFRAAPETQVIQVDEALERWRPTLQFSYNHTSAGPVALLQFGDDTVMYRYELRSKKEVQDLATLLRNASSQL